LENVMDVEEAEVCPHCGYDLCDRCGDCPRCSDGGYCC